MKGGVGSGEGGIWFGGIGRLAVWGFLRSL